MKNISLIKVHSLYLKYVFNLYEKIDNYFWDNLIEISNFGPKPSIRKQFAKI